MPRRRLKPAATETSLEPSPPERSRYLAPDPLSFCSEHWCKRKRPVLEDCLARPLPAPLRWMSRIVSPPRKVRDDGLSDSADHPPLLRQRPRPGPGRKVLQCL